jgi:N-acetyl-alpha-D-muramate 1-phosphate uridylyltransferase
MVIIAGGLATRLKELSKKIPKSMISVLEKPFLQHQIELLKKHGIKDIVLCVGHFAQQIKDYFGNGSQFGVNIKYSDEGENLLGTGGALKKAEDLLQDNFFVMWGDSYLLLDYQDIWNSYKKAASLGLMVVYKNFNQKDRSNVVVENNKVVLYDKWSDGKDKIYIDNGVSILNKRILQYIPFNKKFALEIIFKQLAEKGELQAYETKQCFYEIGSFNGLKEFEKLILTSSL